MDELGRSSIAGTSKEVVTLKRTKKITKVAKTC
jgi:hypothetical protein